MELYTAPPPGSTVICADELGPVIPRTFPPAPGWSGDGHRIKAPLEYSRGPEKTWVYGGLRVADGQAVTMCAPSRNSAFYQDFLQLEEQANPEGTIWVITDNLSSHDSKSTRAWLEDHPRIRHAFIPKRACWLNMQEGWWRIFRRQALAGQEFADPDEIAHWSERVEVGNAYVNRHITGAIVRRQPFGGWKASVVGPGAKAGGPDYVAELGVWSDSPDVPREDADWLAWAMADDARCWAQELGVEDDPSGLRAESNVLRYRPVPHLTVRVGAGAREVEVERVLAAARLVGTPVTVSRFGVDDDDAFAARVREGRVEGRIRVVGKVEGLRAAASRRVGRVTVLDGPVLASARRELLTVLRAQSISRTRHRFGHVEARDDAR